MQFGTVLILRGMRHPSQLNRIERLILRILKCSQRRLKKSEAKRHRQIEWAIAFNIRTPPVEE